MKAKSGDISGEADIHDVLIFVPTASEFRGILSVVRDILLSEGYIELPRKHSGTLLFSKKKSDGSPYRVIVYCENIRGNMLSAAHTAFICQRFMPKLVISAGIAGSLDPTRAWIGDIVFPASVEHASFDKIYQNALGESAHYPLIKGSLSKSGAFESPIRVADRLELSLPGVSTIVGSLDLERIVHALSHDAVDGAAAERQLQFELLEEYLASEFSIQAKAPAKPRIIEGKKSFSWDKVLDSRDVYKFMVDQGKMTGGAICVEMESWGFVSAAGLFRQVQHFDAVIVRGISDIVGCKGVSDDKDRDLEGVCRQFAMSNVARTVCFIANDQFHRTT